MSSHVTMKVLAAEAGVSAAAVSMALSGSRRVSEETRARIRRLAERLNYRPDQYVSTLMRSRRRRQQVDRPVIGLINGLAAPDGWRNHLAPQIREMREGAIDQATRRGYRTEEFWLAPGDGAAEQLSDMLIARAISGLLLSPLADDAPLPKLKWEHFSAVGLCVPHPSVTLTTVCNDHYLSLVQSVCECHRLGYRRPGLVMRRMHRARFQGRWDAGYFASTYLLSEMTLAKPLLVNLRPEIEPFSTWLAREEPDVIISPHADTLMKFLKTLGRRVPGNIGLVWTSCPTVGHPISGVYENCHLIGATGIDMVASMVERHERNLPPQALTLMIEGIWNPGKTLRSPSRSRKHRPAALATPVNC